MREEIKELISEEQVNARIKELGEQISKDYAGKSVHLVCILKGACLFMCELAKRKSTGVVRIRKDLDDPIKDLHVLIVEDIVDSGRTLAYLGEVFRDRGCASVRTCTLLDKPERRVVDLKVDYTGFEIPDQFVVGYGMDYDQRYRDLPFIGVVNFVEDEQ